jgi:dipeptidyl aminopeptidase/acylaminoacyl peptidase
LLPPDPPASGKIPLIVNIYGGPAGQMVLKEPTNPFDEILARKGFAIFSVDNRGTPGRDRKFQTAIRHEFGAIELKDQLRARSAFRAVPATRSRPHGDLGMVEWRLDDALCDDALRPLSRRSCGGSR